MNKHDLIDKLILFVGCTAISLIKPLGMWHIVPLLFAAISAGLFTVLENTRYKQAVLFSFVLSCLIYPPISAFIPLMAYSSYESRQWYLSAFVLLPFASERDMPLSLRVALLVFSAAALILKHRTTEHEKLRSHYLSLLDMTRSMAREIKEQNKTLTDSQDVKIRLATLNERNRIAREIHDHVGHRLSGAILQIGALLTRNPQDKALFELKETLALSMNSIRSSVHDLHDSSIDLRAQIEDAAIKLTCCRVELEINLQSDPDIKVKYALISAVKEAFSNIARHSGASLVRLLLTEHPAFYQMIISDNGKVAAINTDEGMGLKNISGRVEALRGHFLIRAQNGFEIFITIPKEAL